MRKKHTCRVSFLSLLMASGFSMAETTLESRDEGYKVKFDLKNFKFENFHLPNGRNIPKKFTRLKAPELQPTGTAGSPEILESLIEIAMDSSHLSIRIDRVKEESISLNAPLYPVQEQDYLESPSEHHFSYNQEAYKRHYTGDYINIIQKYQYRHQDVATLAISPVRYDATSNTLTLATEIDFTILCDKPTQVKSAHSREFDALMREKFVNLGNDPARDLPSDTFHKSKYLVITDPQFKESAELKSLLDHRRSTYDVEVVTTLEINVQSKEDFRKFVRGKMPTYLLLVGPNYNDFHPAGVTVGNYPMKSFTYHCSGTTSGRLKPDIAAGLFFVTGKEELANIVNKTLHTEKNIASAPKVFVGHGGNDRQMGKLSGDHCDRIVKEMHDTFFSSAGFKNTHIPTKGGGAKADIDACNSGAFLMNYNGHGVVEKWHHGWGTSDLSKLKNTWYPLVLSCACHTGTFDSYCMATNFVASKMGPSAFIGGYYKSSFGQHILNYAVCEAITKKKQTYGMAFVYGLNGNERTQNPKASAAETPDAAKMERMSAQFHLFGDPAITTLP